MKQIEKVIERNLNAFYEVGKALLTIREERLYRVAYGTFEEYCRDRWQMSRTHANRLIESSRSVENLAPIGVIPTFESQTRPLASLSPEEQREVWKEAVETAPESRAYSDFGKRLQHEK